MKPLRFLPQLLIGLMLALAAAPTARAQATLYASFATSVNMYNSATGNFTGQLATGLSNPWSLTIDSGGRLYSSLYTGDTVAAYNTANGSLISTTFTNPGMFSPTGIATYNGNLYVASQGSQRISKYDAATGSLLTANFIPSVFNPTAMVIDSSGRLYVTNNGGSVSVYNAATGGLISANFITGIVTPMGLALDNAGRLYVSATNGNTVGVYDSLSGALLNASLISGLVNPRALTLDSLGNLYVSSYNSSNSTFFVGKYNSLTGATINGNLLIAGSSIGGLGFVPAAVPEPATSAAVVALLALGLVGWRRCQLRQA